MYRLFVAIDLPEAVKEHLMAICHGIAAARWVPGEQLHLTLRFVGDADEDLFSAIRAGLSQVRSHPFTLALAGTSCFPSPKRPRVLWVGTHGDGTLRQLQQAVEERLVAARVPPDARPFSPHITLARLREPAPAATASFLATHASFASEPFAVDAFHLYSSTLTPTGAIHRREASYPLERQP